MFALPMAQEQTIAMNEHDVKPGAGLQDVLKSLKSIRRWMRAFTVAVLLMTLALLVNGAAVFGYLVEYHAREALLRGGVTAGVALLGFGFGWFAGRWR
jgi:hypothetical protein